MRLGYIAASLSAEHPTKGQIFGSFAYLFWRFSFRWERWKATTLGDTHSIRFTCTKIDLMKFQHLKLCVGTFSIKNFNFFLSFFVQILWENFNFRMTKVSTSYRSTDSTSFKMYSPKVFSEDLISPGWVVQNFRGMKIDNSKRRLPLSSNK